MTVCDAHAHWGSEEECKTRQEQGIRTILSAGTPEQAVQAFAAAEKYDVFSVSAGLHPWYSDCIPAESMLPWMEKAPIIGETGMDSVWCDIPVEIQRKAFIAHLEAARKWGKTVVLHTKGCEAEIAEIISGYDLTFLVHWYSGSETDLMPYLNLNCYFTIGPDICINRSVQNVARYAGLDRILFETDGMNAVQWALGKVRPEKIGEVLENSLKCAADMRKVDADVLRMHAEANFQRLLNQK